MNLLLIWQQNSPPWLLMRLSLKDHQSVNYVKVLNQLSNNYVHVCAALLYQAETETETNSAVWASHPDKNLSTSGVLSPQKPSLISLKLTLLIWVFEFKPQLFLLLMKRWPGISQQRNMPTVLSIDLAKPVTRGNTRFPPILLNLPLHLSAANSSIQAEHMNLHDDHSTQTKTQFRGAQRPQEAGVMCPINKREEPPQDTERAAFVQWFSNSCVCPKNNFFDPCVIDFMFSRTLFDSVALCFWFHHCWIIIDDNLQVTASFRHDSRPQTLLEPQCFWVIGLLVRHNGTRNIWALGKLATDLK